MWVQDFSSAGTRSQVKQDKSCLGGQRSRMELALSCVRVVLVQSGSRVVVVVSGFEMVPGSSCV